MKWVIQAHVQDVAEGQKIIMSNLEHLIENGLIAMECCHGYNDWHDHIKDDPNWDNVSVSIEDLWIICQYVIYTWCPMRCEECEGIDCIECKYENSDVCNDCKRQWVHKDDKFELNLYWKDECEAICKQEG